MKKIYRYALTTLSAALLAYGATSCIGDLNVTPIDPNTTLPEDVLCNEDAFTQLLAKCYQGLSVSSSDGPDADPDIDGVDGGYGQYFRAVFNLQELTTDVATCCWNDGTLYDLHNMTWNASNEFILSMYYRIFFQVSLCNEFIRRSENTTITDYSHKAQYIAEARALRLLSYYHAIDMFGNVPFFTEKNSVGSTGPEQISREKLFEWMESEAKSLLEENDLAEIGKNEYGRCDKGMVKMILAKLYLNAEIWKGEKMYDKCAEVCQSIIDSYPALHATYNDLFCADNHLCSVNTTYNGDEIIFASIQDGFNVRSYGSTNYLVFGSSGGWGNEVGITKGWAGLSLTGAFTSKFSDNDVRARFVKEGKVEIDGEMVDMTFDQYIDEIRRVSDGWSNGWKSMKFTNINHDGSKAQHEGYVDTDWPVFRTADAYLMYAECAARDAADKTKGQQYLNAVRSRAGIGNLSLTLSNIIDERARELYYEGFRRQDLIRFGLFTSEDYLWEFKGGEREGKGVDSHYNLFPITAGDLNANGNLTQNPGY